jgi:hypothetical protein
MRTIGIPDAGLTLVGPGDPDFDHLVSVLLGDRPDPTFEALKAYSVVLYNQSTKTVVAYALRWEYTKPDGKRIHVDVTTGRVTRLLDGAAIKTKPEDDRRGPTIEPHSWAIVTPRTVLKTNSSTGGLTSHPRYGSYLSALQHLASRFSEATDLEVNLDGAFFEDGSFAGPDRSGFFNIFQTEVNAKQKLMAYIVQSVRAGRNLDDVAEEIQASLPASPPEPSVSPDGSLGGLDEFFRHRYASEFLGVYHANGRDLALGWAYYHFFRHPPKLEKK